MKQKLLNQFEAELEHKRILIFTNTLLICGAFSILSTMIMLLFVPEYIIFIAEMIMVFMTSFYFLKTDDFYTARIVFFGGMYVVGCSQSIYFGPETLFYAGAFTVIVFSFLVHDLVKELKEVIRWSVLYISIIPLVFIFHDFIPHKYNGDDIYLLQQFNVINVFLVILLEISILRKQHLATQRHLNQQYDLTEKLKIEYENLYKNLVRNLQYSNKMQGIMHFTESTMLESVSNYFVFSNDKNSSSEFYLVEYVNKRIYFCVAKITGLEIGNGLISNLCYNGLIKAVKVNQLEQADKIHAFISEFLSETFYETENLNIETIFSISVLDMRSNKICSYGNYPISYLIATPNHVYTLKKDVENQFQNEDFQLVIPSGSNFYVLAGIDFHKIDQSFLNKGFLHLETVFKTIFPLPFKNQLDVLSKDIIEVKNEYPAIDTLTIFGLQFEKKELLES